MKSHIKLTFFLIALQLHGCGNTSEIGIGAIHIERQNNIQLEFFDRPKNGLKPVFIVDLFLDSSNLKVKSNVGEFDTVKFDPLYFFPERGVLVLRVVEERKGWLKVITFSSKDQQIAHWLLLPNAKVDNWEEFLLSIYRVRPNSKDNRLRMAPSVSAKEVLRNLGYTCLVPLAVSGDWLQVENSAERCEESGNIKEEFGGFIRWKKGGKILINFFL